MGYSVVNEINLAYNFLTQDSLYHFARLNDPDFVRVEHLNLSYNDLGPESFRLLQPIMSNMVSLKLASTKLNN